jgi:hypothetical protein
MVVVAYRTSRSSAAIVDSPSIQPTQRELIADIEAKLHESARARQAAE